MRLLLLLLALTCACTISTGQPASTTRAVAPQQESAFASLQPATGHLSKDQIRLHIQKHLSQIKYCYEKELAKNPILSGKVEAQFVIQSDGTVRDVQAFGLGNVMVESCVARAIYVIQFPPPKGNGEVNVRYPFIFKASGESLSNNMSAKEDSTAEASRNANVSSQSSPPLPASKAVGGWGYTVTSKTGQSPDDKLDKNMIRRYIRRKLPRIRHCYEKELLLNPSLEGTVVAQFQIATDGHVLSVAAKGLGNTKVERCIESAIKTIKFPKPKRADPVDVRYPFTFKPE